MKLLITGSNGLLGQRLIARAPADAQIIPTFHSHPGIQPNFELLDVTEGGQVESLLERIRPDWVIHTAALTDVDGCELKRDLAWRTNVVGTENIARACESRGTGLLHVSTDYVFDGTSGPYDETAPTHPINIYGMTKLEAEQRVLSVKSHAAVVRTIVLYGYSTGVRPNFVTWLIQSLQNAGSVRVVTDQWGNPTLADDLADFLITLCKKRATGLFHFAGPDLLTRHEMALRVCRRFGLDGTVVPISTSELGQSARRPLRSGLKTDLVQRRFQIRPKSFDDGLNILAEQFEDLNPHGLNKVPGR